MVLFREKRHNVCEISYLMYSPFEKERDTGRQLRLAKN